MKNIYTFRKRAFLNPTSTNQTSYIFAHVESTHDGAYRWGDNLVFIADCHRIIRLEFFLGNARARRVSLSKIDLLIKVLTQFREALKAEVALIDQQSEK